MDNNLINLKNVSFLVMDDFYRNRSARLSDEIKRVVNETRVSIFVSSSRFISSYCAIIPTFFALPTFINFLGGFIELLHITFTFKYCYYHFNPYWLSFGTDIISWKFRFISIESVGLKEGLHHWPFPSLFILLNQMYGRF